MLDLFREGEEGDEGLRPGGDGEKSVAEGVGVMVGGVAWEMGVWI